MSILVQQTSYHLGCGFWHIHSHYIVIRFVDSSKINTSIPEDGPIYDSCKNGLGFHTYDFNAIVNEWLISVRWFFDDNLTTDSSSRCRCQGLIYYLLCILETLAWDNDRASGSIDVLQKYWKKCITIKDDVLGVGLQRFYCMLFHYDSTIYEQKLMLKCKILKFSVLRKCTTTFTMTVNA